MKRNAVVSRIYLIVFAVIMILGVGMTVTAKPKITKKAFGKTADGKAVEILHLRTPVVPKQRSLHMAELSFRSTCTIRAGKLGDIVLGYDSIAASKSTLHFSVR